MLDMRKLFPVTFQDCNFDILKSQHFLKKVEHVSWTFTFFVGFMVSQPCASVSQLPGALRRPQKKHTPGFLEYVSCGFCHLLMISGPRPSRLRLCRSCLRRFGDLRKNTHTPGFLEHVSCEFGRFSLILAPPKYYRHRMTPTTTAAAAAASQQPPCPTATTKQTRTGTKYTVQGIPPQWLRYLLHLSVLTTALDHHLWSICISSLQD